MTSTRSTALVFRSGLARLVAVWRRLLRDRRLSMIDVSADLSKYADVIFDAGRFYALKCVLFRFSPVPCDILLRQLS